MSIVSRRRGIKHAENGVSSVGNSEARMRKKERNEGPEGRKGKVSKEAGHGMPAMARRRRLWNCCSSYKGGVHTQTHTHTVLPSLLPQ